MYRALPEPLRSQLGYGGIVKGGWYPLSWYADLHAAARSELGLTRDFARTVGFESTRDDLSHGIFKFLLKIVSPEFVIGRAPSIFNKYYEQGTMTVDTDRPKRPVCRWEGCSGFNVDIWNDVFGGVEGALVAGGAKSVRILSKRGGNDGNTSATLELALD